MVGPTPERVKLKILYTLGGLILSSSDFQQVGPILPPRISLSLSYKTRITIRLKLEPLKNA